MKGQDRPSSSVGLLVPRGRGGGEGSLWRCFQSHVFVSKSLSADARKAGRESGLCAPEGQWQGLKGEGSTDQATDTRTPKAGSSSGPFRP